MFNQSTLHKYKPLLWFLIGFGSFVYTRVGNYIPWALTVAALFILRYARSRKAWKAILIMSLGFPLSGMMSQLSFHGSTFEIIFNIIQLTIKGLAFMIPYALDRLFYKKLKGFAQTLVFPVSAIAVYYLITSFVLKEGTAYYFAFMQYGNLPLMQILSLAGIWGAGFILLWLASVANWVWENEFQWPVIMRGVAIYSAIFLSLFLYGGIKTSPANYSYDNETVKIASIVYEDITPWEVLDGFKERTFTNLDQSIPIIERRVGEAARAGAQIIALQEYGILIPEEEEAYFVQKMQDIAKENNIYLVANYSYLPPMEQESYEYTFGFIELPDEEEGRNIALLINNSGEVEIEYMKRHLSQLEGNYILNSPTDQFPVVETPYGRIGLVICKDMGYADFMKQAAEKKADIIIAPSSEAAKALAITYSQMLRCVEYGFSFVRPCNYGLSVAVDYHGNILGSMNSFTTPLDTMYAHVPIKGINTLYGVIGDLFAWICCLGLLILIVLGFEKKGQKP